MKLHHQGLRAVDRAHELGRLNVVRGPVGSGKTTVLDAVAFAALGFIPRLGRSEESTRALVRGSDAAVALTLDDGRRIDRGLGKAKGSRAECRVSWNPKAKLTEAQTAAALLFGPTLDAAARMIDCRELLKATGRERARIVDAMLDGAGSTADAGARARRLLAARLASVSEDRVPDDPAAQRTLSGSPVFDDVASLVAATLAKSGFAAAIEEAKDRKNRAAAESREKVAGRQSLEDRALAFKAPAESEDALRKAHGEAVAAKSAAEERIRAADAQERTAVELRQAVERAREAHAFADAVDPAVFRANAAAKRQEADGIADPVPPAAPVVEVEAPGVAAEVARLREVAARDANEAATHQDPPRPTTIVPTEAQREEVAHLRRMAEIPRTAIPDTTAAEARLCDAVRAVRAAEALPWREVEKIADALIALDGPDLSCQRSILLDSVDALRDLAKTNGGDLAVLASAWDEARDACDVAIRRRKAAEEKRAAEDAESARLTADADALWSRYVIEATSADAAAQGAWSEACAAAKAKRDALLASAATARKAADALAKQEADRVSAINADRSRAYREAAGAAANATAANVEARKRLRAEADAADARAQAAEADRAKTSADLAAAEARLAGLALAEYDRDADAKTVEAAAARIAELATKLDALGRAAGLRAELAALLAEIDRADALRAAWAAAEWALAKMRDEDVARRSRPLEERMEAFLRGAGRTETPYVLCEGGATDFGWRNAAGECVSLDGALSGGESVLMLTALATAVVGLAAPEVRVLLIEAAELHGHDADSLLRGCEAVADGFDAILVAGPASLPARLGWTVIDFAEAAAAAGGAQ